MPSRLPNILESFASFNSIFSLAVMSASDLESGDYLKPEWDGLNSSRTVFRSAGMTPDSKAKISSEGEGIFSYFIDDVTINSLPAFSVSRGQTNSASIDFTIYEPYSMGMLLQHLFVASQNAGYDHYIGVPLLLRVNFTGFDTDGNPSDQNSFSLQRNMPFMIRDMQIEYTTQGSRYTVQGVPWVEQALMSPYGNLPQDFSFSGETVKDALVGGSQGNTSDPSKPGASLQESINDFYKKAADRNATVPHKVKFVFPEVNDKSSVDRENDNNKWGKSKFTNKTSMNMQEYGENTDSNTVQKRVSDYKDGIVSFTFPAGTSIVKVITDVILNSDEMQKFIDQDFAKGKKSILEYFKIDAEVYVEQDEKTYKTFSEYPRTFVYKIVPYEIANTRLRPPGEIIDYTDLVNRVVKEYNFLYTGQNKDVLDFNIKLDHMFFVPTLPSFRQVSELYQNAAVKQKTAENYSYQEGVEQTKELQSLGTARRAIVEKLVEQPGGLYKNTPTATDAFAYLFNNAMLNSGVDLAQIELTILGDPYFITDELFGNFTAEQGDYVTISKEGSISFARSECDIMIKFRSPVDIDTEKGTYVFQEDTGAVFSGIYQVVEITSSFSGGNYTTSLRALRRPESIHSELTENPTVPTPKFLEFVKEEEDLTEEDVDSNDNGTKSIDSRGNVVRR